ncbi:hypothetical protein ACQRBN_09500 [Bariatricus sp. SGI.154]|uniref:hypothetical protein n=1 Tax=Bariatricus sp. SGI.154 TaxID=3420549 RepID=UPI003CFCA157
MWELDGNLVYEELFIKRTAERSSMGIQIRLQSSTIRKFKRGLESGIECNRRTNLKISPAQTFLNSVRVAQNSS